MASGRRSGDVDEQLARALQAQEIHRARHPSASLFGRAPDAGREVIRENRALAIEANPEAFVPVEMLYVQCTLNGERLRAFVDTGAQMTVITRACAERCGLSRLIDTKFRGVAAGVGTAHIVGRVHLAELQLGGSNARVSLTLTVLDQRHGPELLLGLDMMRKYRAVIDLERGCLQLGDLSVPFVTGR